jgi:hypothetical protein
MLPLAPAQVGERTERLSTWVTGVTGWLGAVFPAPVKACPTLLQLRRTRASTPRTADQNRALTTRRKSTTARTPADTRPAANAPIAFRSGRHRKECAVSATSDVAPMTSNPIPRLPPLSPVNFEHSNAVNQTDPVGNNTCEKENHYYSDHELDCVPCGPGTNGSHPEDPTMCSCAYKPFNSVSGTCPGEQHPTPE